MDLIHENAFAKDFIPPMTTITSGNGLEVLPDLFCLPIQIVNICFIGNPKETNEFVLVDAGMPKCADVIMNAAKKRFGQNCKAKAIVLTHGHFDHVGSLIELAEAWDVPVYAHRLEMPYVTGKANYPPADSTVDKGLIAKISPMFPNHGIDAGSRVQPLPADGTIHEMDGWRWIHTSGHTPGHISLFRDKDRALIAGDAFVTVKQESLYKVITQKQEISGPPKYFTTDWEAARESVWHLETLKPSLAITGHGLPLIGEELVRELQRLAERFDEMAMPEKGRYLH